MPSSQRLPRKPVRSCHFVWSVSKWIEPQRNMGRTILHTQSSICFDMTVQLFTGHSLRGALATLPAYDIRKQLVDAGKRVADVVCYSFGAPRTGNHAFARDYNRMVPDTWSIINDQVAVKQRVGCITL